MNGSRGGFTLVELTVAIIVLTVGVLALLGTSRVAAISLQRATLEARLARLLEIETERLAATNVAALVDGSENYDEGTSRWVVTDSVGFRTVELVVAARPESGRTLTDTVYLYRLR